MLILDLFIRKAWWWLCRAETCRLECNFKNKRLVVFEICTMYETDWYTEGKMQSCRVLTLVVGPSCSDHCTKKTDWPLN